LYHGLMFVKSFKHVFQVEAHVRNKTPYICWPRSLCNREAGVWSLGWHPLLCLCMWAQNMSHVTLKRTPRTAGSIFRAPLYTEPYISCVHILRRSVSKASVTNTTLCVLIMHLPSGKIMGYIAWNSC
jgi:hypothetical protein